MKTIKLTRGRHRDKACIFIECERDQRFETMIRSYPGRIWSQSNRSWYIEDREDSFRELSRYFRGRFRIDSTGLHNKQLEAVRQPGEETDDIPAQPCTIRHKETEAVDNMPSPSGSSSFSASYDPVEFSIDYSNGRLIIRFTGRYSKEWIKELRQYGKPFYNESAREWYLTASRATIDSLADYFSSEGIKVNSRKASKPEGLKKKVKDATSSVRKRVPGKAAIEAVELLRSYLSERRYSRHTIKTYASQLEYFLKYCQPLEPADISNEDFSLFMEEHINELGYSASFQNQVITAIKTYYSLVPESHFEIDIINRPRKSRPLPQVFSKEEVTTILNSTRNLKHRLILWITYSCGLRRSEVINIKLSDLNRDRGVLHIRSGKGNIDRLVPVSARVWEKIDEYKASYHPLVWLFEGQSGGQYTVSSVYNVFKTALVRAGIDRDVGIHSLRHSYATHLHESGLDIRYIQELLGHQSSKTTEIYTHVSRRQLAQIKSPIDDLDLH
ncbi:MAG: tyrosine-type recombinase/integrase [Marinilabiliaceae bacterium]|jgi:integrase/recombinase XerD|nr:tyrosine-type recombinase/integrase [Marinilabiliaceae bacterium]